MLDMLIFKLIMAKMSNLHHEEDSPYFTGAEQKRAAEDILPLSTRFCVMFLYIAKRKIGLLLNVQVCARPTNLQHL